MTLTLLRLPLGAAAIAVAAAVATPAAGAPSRIVYVCGQNLCAIDPDTGTRAPITTDNRGYGSPSITTDGTRLAASSGFAVVAGPFGTNLPETWQSHAEGLNDVAIAPDGRGVAHTYWYTKLELVYQYSCGGLCTQVVHYNAARFQTAAGEAGAGHTGSSGVGFLRTALLSTDSDIGTWDSAQRAYVGGTERVCVVAAPADDAAKCEPRILEPSPATPGAARINFTDPEGSPDGALVAVTAGTVPAATGALVDNPTGENPAVLVYDAASGAKVATFPNATNPAFSPDSRQLAYAGTDGTIHVAPARGGAPRALVAGDAPTWGAAPAQMRVARAARLRVTAAGAGPLRVTCPPATANGCAGTVEAVTTAKLRRPGARSGAKAKRTVARAAYRVAAGRTASVRLRPTALGRGYLRAARRLPVTVAVTPTRPFGAPVTVRTALTR